MSKTIAAADLQAEFEAFLVGRGVELAQVNIGTLLTALVAFYKEVSVEGCNPADERDYLHYEGGDGVPYFERIVYALPDEIDPEYPDQREKLSLTVGPEFYAALAKAQHQPSAPVNLWSMDFADADAFAAAVRAEPSFQAAAEWGEMAGEVAFEELG